MKAQLLFLGVSVMLLGMSCRHELEVSQLVVDESVMLDEVSARKFFDKSQMACVSRSFEQHYIKPMPGDFTPVWSKATTTQTGAVISVDVPIKPTLRYSAFRRSHAHDENCHHQWIDVSQKLVIYQLSGGGIDALIATIVPFEYFYVDEFTYAGGLEGLTGFVAFYTLSGKFVRVDEYVNGVKERSVLNTPENNELIVDIVDDAVLVYKHDYDAVSRVATANDPFHCDICDNTCPDMDNPTSHCYQCFRYYRLCTCCKWCSQVAGNCICPHCEKCHKKAGECICHQSFQPDPTNPNPPCSVCGSTNCSNPGHGDNGVPVPSYPKVHDWIFSYFVMDSVSDLRQGCGVMDDEFTCGLGTEYIHGLWVMNSQDRTERQAKMKYQFTSYMKNFLEANAHNGFLLGQALHPIMDMYLPLQTRIDRLSYYSYNQIGNLLDGLYPPYSTELSSITPCVNAVQKLYNSCKALGPLATEAQIGVIYDVWVSDSQRGGSLI